jgi:hypothetical protein
MVPPSEQNSPYQTERQHANALLRGIDLAVEETIGDTDRDISRLEQEKLCYFAITEFEIPITYSWYIAGPYTKIAGEPDDASGPMERGSPDLSLDRGIDDEVRKYKNYLVSEEFFDSYSLSQIWYTDNYEFLIDFYNECADSEYVDLYVASAEVRKQFSSLMKNLHRESQSQSLSDWGVEPDGGLLSPREEKEARQRISELHIEMSKIDELSDVKGTVVRGTDVVEQVFAKLTTISELSNEQRDALNDLSDFFYYYVWRFPALYISTQTSTGPNSHHLIEEHASRFLNFESGELVDMTKSMQQRCYDIGLYPEAGHHTHTLGKTKHPTFTI